MLLHRLRYVWPILVCLLFIHNGTNPIWGQAAEGTPPMNSRQILFVGTYTQAGSVGIYRFEFLPESATLKPLGEPTPLENPSFLELHPRQDRLYVVSETNDYEGEKSGSVAAYQITNLDGELKFLNQVSTRGGSPCHLTLPAEGTAVLVANYSGGNVVSLPLTKPGLLQPVFSNQQHAGSSVNPQRQRQPLARSGKRSAATGCSP